MTKFDAIVIGAGQAGSPLSQKLADQGWTVALVEQGQLGGTCVNTGCTPTKTMIASAQVAHYARQAGRWGVQAADVRADLRRIVARKDKIVGQWRSGLEKKIEDRKNLHWCRGHARFVAPHCVRVAEEEVAVEELESDRIFIDAGARPNIPRVEGLDRVNYLTNASILELTELPEHLLILGGGYIGLEFGQMFRRFGSQVTIVDHNEQILPREDAEVADELRKALQSEGIRFVLRAETDRVATQCERIALSVRVGSSSLSLEGSHLLVATGRRPNSDDLGLDAAGVETDGRGFIRVNSRLETSVPGIWALGDINGGPAFTHISYNDFQIVYANLIEGRSLSTDNRQVPYCVFTDPQLGRVGLTEKEARATGRQLKIGRIPMSWVARAIERDETAGLMKLVVDTDTDRILGAAVLGIEGGEVIQILGTVMLAGAPFTLLKGAVYIHPTLAEGLWTLMEQVKSS